MRLLKKSGFFEKTKKPPHFKKKFSLLCFCVAPFLGSILLCTQKNFILSPQATKVLYAQNSSSYSSYSRTDTALSDTKKKIKKTYNNVI